MTCAKAFIIIAHLLMLLGLFVSRSQCQTTPISSLTVTSTYSTCTTTEIFPQLPNLVFAKAFGVVQSNFTCTRTKTTPATPPLTWYYYQQYPPPPTCSSSLDCHSTAVSVFNFTSVLRQNLGSNYLETMSGSVSSGPYSGKPVTRITTVPLANEDACLTAPGLEMSTGSLTLNIDGGPFCTGIISAEYYPGLH